MKKRVLSALVAVLFLMTTLISAMPISAKTAVPVPKYDTPEGYNEHDYQKIVAFLEFEKPWGDINGASISMNYDPTDPETWGTYYYYDDECGYSELPCFEWTEIGGEKRLTKIRIDDDYCVLGDLNVSDCTELTSISLAMNELSAINASGCASLKSIGSDDSEIEAIDLSGCRALERVSIGYSSLPSIDVSDCPVLESFRCNGELTELDVSHNPLLKELVCGYNMITELDVSNNPLLEDLDCTKCRLAELDVSHNPLLKELDCSQNMLTELDVSHNPELSFLACSGNLLEELDLTENPAVEGLICLNNPMKLLALYNNLHLSYDLVAAEGDGFFGYEFAYYYGGYSGTILATPMRGAEFEGFYDEDGELLTMGEYDSWSNSFGYYFYEMFTGTLTARFTEAVLIPADANCDGIVDTTDALMVLRAALGITENADELISNCDMDHNGTLDTTDALLVLRLALNIG